MSKARNDGFLKAPELLDYNRLLTKIASAYKGDTDIKLLIKIILEGGILPPKFVGKNPLTFLSIISTSIPSSNSFSLKK